MSDVKRFAEKYGFVDLEHKVDRDIRSRFYYFCDAGPDTKWSGKKIDPRKLKKHLNLLLEYAGRPEGVGDLFFVKPVGMETRLYNSLSELLAHLPKKDQIKFWPKILQAVHLPCLDVEMLCKIEANVQYIPEAKALVKKAKEKQGPVYILSLDDSVDLWCVPRVETRLEFFFTFRTQDVKEKVTKFSPVFMLHGFPFCVSCSVTKGNMQVTVHFLDKDTTLEYVCDLQVWCTHQDYRPSAKPWYTCRKTGLKPLAWGGCTCSSSVSELMTEEASDLELKVQVDRVLRLPKSNQVSQ